MPRFVIVGNGIAGMTAADTLRAEGFAGEVVLVGDEDHPPYSRPALSKALLRDEDDLNSHLLPPPTHGARELRGVRAVGLDPEGRTVFLDNGEELSYDGLIITTGCRSRRVPLWSAAIEQAKVAARTLLGVGDDTANPAGVPPYFWTEQFGLALKLVGHLPLRGEPTVLESDPAEGKFLLQWTADAADPTGGAAAAINYRIPIPKLRRLAAGTA